MFLEQHPAATQSRSLSRLPPAQSAITNPFTIDTGSRYAFVPKSDPESGSLHLACIVVADSDHRRGTAGREPTAATEDCARAVKCSA